MEVGNWSGACILRNKGGIEGGREGGREGGMEGGREGGREGETFPSWT